MQASAAQALHQQGEVVRLLVRCIPEPMSTPPVAPVEEAVKSYEDSRGRGRDPRGAMLDVRA